MDVGGAVDFAQRCHPNWDVEWKHWTDEPWNVFDFKVRVEGCWIYDVRLARIFAGTAAVSWYRQRQKEELSDALRS